MKRTRTSILISAVLATAGLPAAVQASDISLFAHLPSVAAESDPIAVQVLGMEEVDVWGRIRKGFGIPDIENQLVTHHVNWYSSRPDYIQRTTTRASRYLFHVVQELEKRNMPTELALLPFIESAFNPQAVSTAQAAGMWQFIPSTGRDFNLKQNFFKDERRSVLASTDAALSYLQKLYGMFGDWQLALAAYNWGEGSVQRAINKAKAAGRGTDYTSLMSYMPAETRNYVPKLQAVKNIIAHPENYNLKLPKVDNQPYFVTIGKTRDIDIKVAAQLAELSLDEFKALNPQFNRPVITGGSNTQILLPKSNAEKFRSNLSNWGRNLSSWTAHRVTNARERIDAIAKRFRTTPEILREVNHIPPRMALKEGSTILVPKAEDSIEKDIAPELLDTARMTMEPEASPTRKIRVTVGAKDTLASIGRRHGVSVAQIKTWNDLSKDTVARGQKLELEVPNKRAVATKGTTGKKTTQAASKKTGKTKVAAKSKKPPRKPTAVVKKPVKNGGATATAKAADKSG
ncbi:transglycosylase SLT domain-containing protein [Lacisediminimonas sp.]|uniref:transglycosylase SLT domain-containing protein n=1 Tax=Lacisediminimonas sp. TaxID=3060582 RepID=UPI00271F97AD|nr:transglycosylase SLT domain-containing protein [Lacisediminimonas sp.]MDO8298980.1 transglycosylase SLT domain-containing protein [Lacisediminimonas sp.]